MTEDEDFDPLEPFWNLPTRSTVIARYLQCESQRVEDDSGAVLAVTGMTFLAPMEAQWAVIKELVRNAPEAAFAGIAAGPVEGFLARFGESAIGLVEGEARSNAKFRKVLAGVWQNIMPDEVWTRVRALQDRGASG